MTPGSATVVAAASDLVRDGSLVVAIPVAALAGLVSFLSPCVLPLVPAYLSYVTGISATELADAPAQRGSSHTTARIALGSLGFMLGVSAVFVSFGALFGQLGQVLRDHETTLARVFGVITIVLGLILSGVFGRLALFDRDLRLRATPRAGCAGAALLGLTFALGWTPCIGPTLGAVLGLAASSNDASAARGAVLSLAYCLGLGVPFLLTGLAFTRAMRALAVVKRHYRTVMAAGGAMLVLLGLLQVSGVWLRLMNELQTRFGSQDLPL